MPASCPISTPAPRPFAKARNVRNVLLLRYSVGYEGIRLAELSCIGWEMTDAPVSINQAPHSSA